MLLKRILTKLKRSLTPCVNQIQIRTLVVYSKREGGSVFVLTSLIVSREPVSLHNCFVLEKYFNISVGSNIKPVKKIKSTRVWKTSEETGVVCTDWRWVFIKMRRHHQVSDRTFPSDESQYKVETVNGRDIQSLWVTENEQILKNAIHISLLW